MPNKLIIAPAVEPVTLAQARLHLRVDNTDDDTLIAALIAAARADAEHRTERAFVTQTREQVVDHFPFGCVYNTLTGQQQQAYGSAFVTRGTAHRNRNAIEIRRTPIQSVESVKYIDPTGTEQTLDPAQYQLDADGDIAYLFPAYGVSWPITRLQPNAVRVRYVCGYGDDGTTTPPTVISWILLRVGVLYENRESHVLSKSIIQEAPHDFAQGLLDPVRVLSL